MELDVKRRTVMKVALATLVTGTAGCTQQSSDAKSLTATVRNFSKVEKTDLSLQQDIAVRDSLQKVKYFDNTFAEDIFLKPEQIAVFKSTLARISRVQKVVGYANFNLLSLDEMLLYANRYPQVGCFTKEELVFIEDIFSRDVNEFGFYGDKVLSQLSSTINRKETVKIRGTGHYLFQGDAINKFRRLQKDVGDDLVLTSGVRSIVKQFKLFLAKLAASNGNLSMASRSLAPPGHSYHGIGDFDVGKRDFGKLNFTAEFANTAEYHKLIQLKYVDLRYTRDNQVGVRYEPWHIKVV